MEKDSPARGHRGVGKNTAERLSHRALGHPTSQMTQQLEGPGSNLAGLHQQRLADLRRDEGHGGLHLLQQRGRRAPPDAALPLRPVLLVLPESIGGVQLEMKVVTVETQAKSGGGAGESGPSGSSKKEGRW